MKPHASLLFFLLISLFSCHRGNQSLTDLFKSLQQAAQKKDEAKLRDLTLDYTVRKPSLNLQEGIVQGILTNREKGDFAYSSPAMRRLIQTHLNQFQRISADEFKSMYETYKFAEHPQLKQLTDQDVWRFQQDAVTIVVLQLDESYKLFYWRDLPQLK